MNWDSLLRWDNQISTKMRLTQDQPGWKLVAFLAHSGDSWFWLAGLGLVWLAGSRWWHQTSALLGIGVVVLAALVLAIKFTVRRSRPPGEWGAVYRNTDPHSFPSGHAARSAMLAVMALGLGPAWFGWLVLIWAPLVSLARVMTGMHYVVDVLAGLVLGVLMGFAMLAAQPLWMAAFPFVFTPLWP